MPRHRAEMPRESTNPVPAGVGAYLTAGEPLTLVLPLPSNRGQSRHGHWAQRYKDGDAYAVDALCWPNPKPPRVPFDCVRLSYHIRHGGNAMDWDNLFARLKHPQDWLVHQGYLVDDSPRVVIDCPTVTQEPRQPKPQRALVITITPMREAA